MGDPHVERVLAITMAVATEVAVLHERFDTLARVAGRQDRFSLQDLEDYAPPPEVTAERDAWRRDYLRRILRVLEEAAPRETGRDSTSDPAGYAAFIDEISQAKA